MENIKIINQQDVSNLKIIINIRINEKFKKLNIDHKNILKKYLFKTCILTNVYFHFDKFIEQLTINNCQDIFSLMNLLLPYYELNNSGDITTFDEIFKNTNDMSGILQSTYFVDHSDYTSSSDYLEKYFQNSLKAIENTFKKISSKLLPNWLNIFPITIDNYTNSYYYKNISNLVSQKKFVLNSDTQKIKQSYIEYIVDNSLLLEEQNIENNFILGYDNLYGTIYNFLFNDIKTIKWMIYDYVDNDKLPVPNIIILSQTLGIYFVCNRKWEEIDDTLKNNIQQKWTDMKKNSKYFSLIKSLILFYLRWEYNEEALIKIKLDEECKKIIRTKLKRDDENFDDNIIYENINKKDFDNNIERCIGIIKDQIEFEFLYTYIYKCMQKFSYTWYGFVCMSSINNILTYDQFINSYSNYNIVDISNNFIVTPKNIYNFFKSLIHEQSGKEYLPISNCYNWDSLNEATKELFINRLNTINTSTTRPWFNISNNLKRIYTNLSENKIKDYNQKIKDSMVNKNIFSKIIIETLVINNMLSYVKYNPVVTDSRLLPDKNKNTKLWEEKINSNIKIEDYASSFSFLSNRKLSSYNEDLNYNKRYKDGDIYKSIKETKWYNNFGANWIAQIQIFHHILNQRILYVTGATGAGKSTVFPFMVLYGHKMLFFNNNCKVLCTQPRVQPAVQNPDYIARFLGVPFVERVDKFETNSLNSLNKSSMSDEELLSKYVTQNINYLQYKHQKDGSIDNEYHPSLRFLTDWTLLHNLKKN